MEYMLDSATLSEIKDLIKDLNECINVCSQCDGKGLMYSDKTIACEECGGQGKILNATSYIVDIQELNKKLETL